MPDYTGSCIKDDFTGQIEIEDLSLPKDYNEVLSSWHRSYREIIPLSAEQRKIREDDIERLDRQGLGLAKKLQELIPGGVKVKYFSEGLLKYLPL